MFKRKRPVSMKTYGCSGTHYSLAFDIEKMRKNCDEISHKLYAYRYKHECEITFIYRGMSGVATATALAHRVFEQYRIIPHMVYIRKKHEENHHACRLEYSDNLPMCDKMAVFFVDDLIDSGDTCKKTIKGADVCPVIRDYTNRLKDCNVGIILLSCVQQFHEPEKILERKVSFKRRNTS